MFLVIWSTGRLNLWAKYAEPKKQTIYIFFLSELQELEVRLCVQPKSLIIILILLNGFRKFVMSTGPKHQCNRYQESQVTSVADSTR